MNMHGQDQAWLDPHLDESQTVSGEEIKDPDFPICAARDDTEVCECQRLHLPVEKSAFKGFFDY